MIVGAPALQFPEIEGDDLIGLHAKGTRKQVGADFLEGRHEGGKFLQPGRQGSPGPEPLGPIENRRMKAPGFSDGPGIKQPGPKNGEMMVQTPGISP